MFGFGGAEDAGLRPLVRATRQTGSPDPGTFIVPNPHGSALHYVKSAICTLCVNLTPNSLCDGPSLSADLRGVIFRQTQSRHALETMDSNQENHT
jgi:hypothetical protein